MVASNLIIMTAYILEHISESVTEIPSLYLISNFTSQHV